ncbi:MAG: tRNA pseudouridine(38-40) synthase TruA [Clostridiales bacterium]|nr:tRNA pseudouridine(38-40) synthase TruA [Clostridiales bacterium]
MSESRRLLLTLRYDGTGYHGWQVQKNGVTVQETLQNALEAVLAVRPSVTGCSRTDAGVHAEQFCCHLDTTSSIPPEKLAAALNAHLPGNMAVCGCREVSAGFHARYDCKGKTYRYQIYNSRWPNPFYDAYAWRLRSPVDMELLAASCKPFLGRHDFAGFSAAGSSVVDTVRTLSGLSAEAHEIGTGERLICLRVTADGFLYNMVRILTGTLAAVQQGKIRLEELPDILASRNRNRAGPTAPPQGLFLEKVFY